MRARPIAIAALALAAALTGQAGAVKDDLVLASPALGAATPDGDSFNISISADGRFVAFRSDATNLHPDDSDGANDIFVRDLKLGTTTLVSRGSGASGVKGNFSSNDPSISADGRFVAFRSDATNLHPDDITSSSDIFVRDLELNTTTLVSRQPGAAGVKGNGSSGDPSISSDGRFVAFRTTASNLDLDDADATADIYVRDLRSHATALVSRASGSSGAKGNSNSGSPSISADGRFVAFASFADNLDGDDADTWGDIFVRDLRTHGTVLASRSGGPSGVKQASFSSSPSISGDGRFVAFQSFATLHPDDPGADSDVLVRDLDLHDTTLASRATGETGVKGAGNSFGPSISADGRFVGFHSSAPNLDPGDGDTTSDVFVRDLEHSTTTLVSRATGADGIKGDSDSEEGVVSADGRFVAFTSYAENLDPGAANGGCCSEVFRRTIGLDPPVNITAPKLGGQPVKGAELSCSNGEWSDGALTRAWRRDGAPIAGATGPTYTPSDADVGGLLDCLVTATNADGSASAASNAALISEPLQGPSGPKGDPGDPGEPGEPAIKLLLVLGQDSFAASAGGKLRARLASSAPGKLVAKLKGSKGKARNTKLTKKRRLRRDGVSALTIKLVAKAKGKVKRSRAAAKKRPIPPGRYRLTLKLTGEDGQRATDSATVMVRKPRR